jgi:hypothetical protein
MTKAEKAALPLKLRIEKIKEAILMNESGRMTNGVLLRPPPPPQLEENSYLGLNKSHLGFMSKRCSDGLTSKSVSINQK